MRVSTAGASLVALNAMAADQAALQTTQSQLSSGLAVQTPADNPTAYAHVLQIQQALAASTQYEANSNVAQARLSTSEQTLTSVTNVLQSISQLAVEANNSSLGNSARQQLNTQITTDIQQLVGLANTQDANGEYLYSGNATTTQPYSVAASGAVAYGGDTQSRQVQIGPSQTVTESDPGTAVFGSIPNGNGTFVTGTHATNTGSGVVDGGTVTNPAAWVPDSYQVQFTSPTTYNVVNSASTVVASGTFSPGSTVQFNGASVTISGQPATGDVFTVAPSGTEDVFTTLNKLVATIGQNVNGTGGGAAQLASALGASIQQLTTAINHISAVSATVGARLQQITSNSSSQGALKVQLQTTLSQTQSVDYAAAISQMNLQYTALQAAQQSYAKFAQLSLFNYL